jgi:hypothetical protein
MRENILYDILRNLLNAWYLDINYLVDIIQKHDLDFDNIYENIELNFSKESLNDINYFIYEALNQVANKFLESNEYMLQGKNTDFEIYTNYIDSHIWFYDEYVQSLYEKF